MYIRKYNKFKDHEVIGEHVIPLPDPPNLYDMINYRLSKKNQKFYHTEIPKDLLSWNTNKREEFIHEEWTRRKNGIWLFINGIPVYIPPTHYYFLIYWKTEQGYIPSFKDGQRKIFLFLDYVFRDENAIGTFIVKPRGVGWTDIADCIILERATRIRQSWHSMYHMNYDDNLDSFKRIVAAYNQLPFYFKPMTSGSDLFKSGRMRFERPATVKTKKTNSQQFDALADYDDASDVIPLNSEIIVQPTVQGKGDSKRHKTVYFDEFGKMLIKNTAKIDLLAHHDILKYTMFIENGKKLFGKMLYGSTVEDNSDEGLMVDMIAQMWDNSDHNKRMQDGRTSSGLYRLLIPATWGCETDEFGMHKEEEFLKEYNENIKYYLSNGKLKDLISYRRKQCMTIEDALAFPSTTYIYDQEKLETKLYLVRNPIDEHGVERTHTGVRGNFYWIDGVRFGKVAWRADANGKWVLYRDEKNNNAHFIQSGYKVPANRHLYGMGVDPYETKKLKLNKTLSDGAFIVFRNFDKTIDDEDHPVSTWKTHQVYCEYSYRDKDPAQFNEDVLMTAVYYGTDCLIEKGKGNYLTRFFEENGYIAYLQYAHRAYATKADMKEPGATPNKDVIADYVMMTAEYISKYADLINSEELLKQLLTFENNSNSRTKRDLAVAFGWALMARHKNYAVVTSELSNEEWFTMYSV